MYNIPRVTDVTDILQKWVYNPAYHQHLLNAPNKEIPEIVRWFTGDIYMCVYVNPILDLYDSVYDVCPALNRYENVEGHATVATATGTEQHTHNEVIILHVLLWIVRLIALVHRIVFIL